MKQLQFVSVHDPILDSFSKELSLSEIVTKEMQILFDQMITLAKGEQGDFNKSVLVGLAAPQIGKNIRVILVDIKADGKGSVSDLHLYINPVLIEISQETTDWYEGCYSTGDVKGIVKRANKVTISALNRNAEKITETHSGYAARIFQHEIDHLNGIRFPTIMNDQTHVHIVKNDEMRQYRNEQGWQNWPVKVPLNDWKKYI